MNVVENSLTIKRPVNKVRRHFLSRRPDEDEPEFIDPTTRYITNKDVWTVLASILHTKAGRKTPFHIQFISSHFNIDNITVGNHPQSKLITLNLKVNQKNVHMPWEYMAKRLENDTELESLAKAQEMARMYAGYVKGLSTNFGLLPSDDSQREVDIRKVKARAVRACREIESKYQYVKVELFVNKETATFISVSYNEGLLKKLGHTLQSFPSWVRSNGIPVLVDGDSALYKEVNRKIFDCSVLDDSAVDLGPEFTVPMYDKDDRAREAGIHYVSIVDPMPEGNFITGYMIVKTKKKSPQMSTQSQNKNKVFEGELDLDDYDSPKKNIRIGVSTSNPEAVSDTS